MLLVEQHHQQGRFKELSAVNVNNNQKALRSVTTPQPHKHRGEWIRCHNSLSPVLPVFTLGLKQTLISVKFRLCYIQVGQRLGEICCEASGCSLARNPGSSQAIWERSCRSTPTYLPTGKNYEESSFRERKPSGGSG